MQDQKLNISNATKCCSFKLDYYFITQATILFYAVNCHFTFNWLPTSLQLIVEI